MSGAIPILFLFAITIHNIEEGIWLTRQQTSTQANVKMHDVVTQDQFLFGLLWVTGFAYLITALYMFYPDIGLFKYAYFGFLGAMIINIIFPHLVSTIIERSYSPGLMTGVLVIIPINGLIIHTGLDLGIITVLSFIFSTLIMGAFLVISIPFSFRLGKQLIHF